jgi:DeoR/GlpR family transcriptional regulator of sugar metabolism
MRYERSLAITKRLADLLSLIRAGTYSSRALAEKLGVSEPTVYRDIRCLKQQGHSIRAVRRGVQWAYAVAVPAKAARRGSVLHP